MRRIALLASFLLLSSAALAQQPNYTPQAATEGGGDAALRAFAAQSASLDGRWSSGSCSAKWYDWSAAGLEITFRDQSGKVDIERVVQARPGGFVTQSVAANHTLVGNLWSYQFLARNKIKIQNLSTGDTFVQARCAPAAADGDAGGASTALAAFAGVLPSYAGRWTDGTCEARWNDWSISGLDITFHDQSGGVDVERVVDAQPGAFVTRAIVVSHGAKPSLWKYQPQNPDTIRVQNMSSGTVFSLRRCPSPTDVTGTSSSGTNVAPLGHSISIPVSGPGPSFSCNDVNDPLGATICGSEYLSQRDRELSQVYYALRQQSSEDQRPRLRQESLDFQQRTLVECGLPATGIPDRATQQRAQSCVGSHYEAIHDRFLQALVPDARAEATRGVQEHIALQGALSTAGFLPVDQTPDGVYGPLTRDAITRFQQAHGLAANGLMSDETALELRRAAGAAQGAASTANASPEPPAPFLGSPAQSAPTLAEPRRVPSTASRALAEAGGANDLLMLANASPDAPNAAINLSGDLTFPSGKGMLCFGPESGLAFEDRIAAATWLASRKMTSSDGISACVDSSLDRLDGILVNRHAIGQLDAPLFNDIAGKLQAGAVRTFVVLSEQDRQAAHDQRELGRAATEQAIKAGRPGFGYAAMANTSATACIVAPAEDEQAWRMLLSRRGDEISLDLGRRFQPKPQMTDADTAYIGGRRGVCGIIVATADQLDVMFKAFQRDQVKGSYGALWLPPEAIQNAAATIVEGSEAAAQTAEKARQSARQEQELRARREEAEGIRREKETQQLRATFGANATAMRDNVDQQMTDLFKEPGGEKSAWAASAFPDAAREANRRASEGWTFVEETAEVMEYGRSNWNGRSLETAVLRVRTKLKNAEIGRYDELCYDLGYQNDAEFQRTRSSNAFKCDNPAPLKQWLVEMSYASSWNAP